MGILDQADQWISERSATVTSLWAKSGSEDYYLRLPQHLIDSACVAETLWQTWVSQSLKNTLSSLWHLNEDQLGRLYCFLAGTHDVGKATVSFQRQIEKQPGREYLLAEVKASGLPLTWPAGEGEEKFPHGTASALILRQWLRSWGLDKMRAVRLSAVLDAHHGFTSNQDLFRFHDRTIAKYPAQWAELHRELIDSMAELTDIEDVLDQIDRKQGPYADAIQLMTGLVIMADWIASNEALFRYDVSESQMERVCEAMDVVKLPPPWKPKEPAHNPKELFQETFAWPKEYELRPVQLGVVEAARAQSGACLMIIEAPTGEGKTEAGLAAAHIIGARSGAQGVFFAAPTMSTANGLFERTTDWARRSSQGGEVASMYLAHSKNQLSEQFQALRYASIGQDSLNHGSAVAHQWLSGRRRGILSDFVVGTVDQVLMMALQARFSMLRHVGLAGKVIIIDEVHAYDAYMSQYLYRALEWLSRYGASVILMSATLPPQQRRDLAAAYASPLIDDPDLECLDSHAYPLITTVSSEGVFTTAVEQRASDLTASVQVLGDDLDTLAAMLTSDLAEGGIALVICNTIARAQHTFDALSATFPDEIELHHAAFIASERSKKEDKLREKLGPRSHRDAGRPHRLVVVATQVAEQSLDIDADLLVTDIAPIDLVIQRVGRLHRHRRPDADRPQNLRAPKIFVRGVAFGGDLPEFEGGAKAIYGAKILLATMANLPKAFRRPDDIAPLVRSTYSDQPDIPSQWQAQWEEACTEERRARSSAERRANTYRFPTVQAGGFDLENLFSRLHSDSAEQVGDEERGFAQVRDAELTVEVIAITTTEYNYQPLGRETAIQFGSEPTYAQARSLAENTVRLPARLTRRMKDFETVIEDLEQQTPEEWASSGLLKGQVALRFDANNIAHAGRFTMEYSAERGLEVISDDS